MNKKLNTFIFLLVGTVINILVMLILLVGLLYLSGFILTAGTDEKVKTIVFFAIVLFSVIGSYFIYSRIVKAINKKWDLEQWIEPIFRRKRS